MCQYKIITWGMDQKGKSHSSAKHGQVLLACTSTRDWAQHPSEEPLGFGWRRGRRCISNNKVAGKLCNTGHSPSVMRCSYKWRWRMYLFFSVGAGLTVNSRLCCWWVQQDVVVLNRVAEILVVGGKLRVNLPLKNNQTKTYTVQYENSFTYTFFWVRLYNTNFLTRDKNWLRRHLNKVADTAAEVCSHLYSWHCRPSVLCPIYALLPHVESKHKQAWNKNIDADGGGDETFSQQRGRASGGLEHENRATKKTKRGKDWCVGYWKEREGGIFVLLS